MKTEKHKYLVPQNIVDMWLKYQSLLNLRDVYVLRPFGCGFRKAKKVALEAEQVKANACKEIYNLYPELKKCKRLDLISLYYQPYLLAEGEDED